MEKRLILLYKAKASPSNLSFNELCLLAEKYGFSFRKQKGSHKIYKHDQYPQLMNFQPDKRNKSKAKKYQVNQLIDFIENNKLV